jgi:hypothetical protein
MFNRQMIPVRLPEYSPGECGGALLKLATGDLQQMA